MTARLADEGGFSLIELLVAMMVGTIILFALFSIVDTATQQQSRAVDRIQANDRGRVAIDVIGRQLMSRVCISGTQGSLVSASANQIEFFASLGLTPESTTQSQRLVLQRRRLTYRPAPDNDVREEVWVGTNPAPALPPAASTTPTRTRTILADVSLAGTTNFFRYYAMTAPPPTNPPTPPEPTQPLTALPLSATNLPKVARINVGFVADGKFARSGSELQNQILDRSPGCYFG